jgi:hypothetical protein
VPFLKALPWGLHRFCAVDTKWDLEHGVLGLEFSSAHYGVLQSGVNLLPSVFSCFPVVSFAFFFGQKATQWGEAPPTHSLYMPNKDRIEFQVSGTELLMLST